MHSIKSENPILQSSPSALRRWMLATRPKTWIASISPVLIGTILVPVPLQPLLFFSTLLFALCIQIGTNFANDYFDFMKGADTNERQGPKRAVTEGWIAPQAMLKGTLLTFAAAAIF